ncbi:methyltransferase domain-containing protein [Altererythrobacter sp. ZODW24]|uniref:methyltransferase domain-containing protein n=1 Tax=Altererythrobacter sp. ZODW24 TaxID=2185142 RepID=UPI000DF7B46B|nr:methyltransferase domain-containing protein [Altererythrobacter sp. ZODW24]
MEAKTPPQIFSAARRRTNRERMHALQQCDDAARYVLDDMVEDAIDRLDFMHLDPKFALVIGDWTGGFAKSLTGAEVVAADPAGIGGALELEEGLPFPARDFDLIASFGTLDTVNDLPGALIHIREALAPGGFFIGNIVGAGSLQNLRGALLQADGDRPAARMHPMVDVRAGAELMQRAGFSKQVVDGHSVDVRFGSLERLISDLREQGLGNALKNRAASLDRFAYRIAQQAFAANADADGKVAERFEIITLSGWKS